METLTWQKKLSQASIDFTSPRKTIISELVDGRDSAVRLQTLLKESRNHVSAALAEKILRSFTDSIYMLSSIEWPAEFCDDGGSEESGAGQKRSGSGLKRRRGCYKRR